MPLRGECNGRHLKITHVAATNLFYLHNEDKNVAENLNPRVLVEFAFLDGAYSVAHDYDLSKFQYGLVRSDRT